MTVAVELKSVSKVFGATRAVDKVDLKIHQGQVHAILGENGAGKSTIMKILSGVFEPTEGELLLDGVPTQFPNPRSALDAGIATVHQEASLCPDLSVLDNLFLGKLHHRFGRVRWNEMRERAEATMTELGVSIPLSAKLQDIGKARAHMVQIARSLIDRPRILILDEPTAALTEQDAKRLFELVRRLKSEGSAIIYITHRLDEVSLLADSVTVLRNGRKMAEALAASADKDWIIRNMVGEVLSDLYERNQQTPGDTVLEIAGLSCPGVFRDVSMVIRKGEIVGLAGLVGAGRSEVAEAILGLRPSTGNIAFKGRPLVGSPADRIARGIALVPEDRSTQGLLLDFSLVDNLTLSVLDRTAPHGIVNRSRCLEIAKRFMGAFQLRPADPTLPVSSFSGGNQQKILLGKWLATEPQLLILDEPTRGVDVGAKAEIHQFIDQLAATGLSVLMISSDLPELLGMSDRILTMYDGRIVAEHARGCSGGEVIEAASGLGGKQAA